MENEFKILNISKCSDSKYGTVIVVKANPVNYLGGVVRIFAPYLNESTKTFIFPNKECLYDELAEILRKNNDWTPDMSDFLGDNVIDETNKSIDVYRHISFIWGGIM